MSKIVGFDLGTNSIGTAVRNTLRSDELSEQMEYYSVDIFDSGVGNKKGNEYSYAADRSQGVRQRRLYDVRRRRRWETLKYLITIEPGYCPLSSVELEEWMTYDKSKGLFRKFPIDNKKFMQWIRMDFDGDGVSDCTPYELRYQLVHRQFDFSDPIERYRFGRAMFHICQHRGFRSSKGETLAEQANNGNDDLASEMKQSEIKKSGKLTTYMDEHECKTAGEALYLLNKDGYRIRNSEYQVVRSMLKDEIREIFTYQDGLSLDSDLYIHLTSEKKKEGCIFYKNPLRSQKGLVGKCTLEPSKRRAPISHPEYEKYRALCFIANIRVRKNVNDEWEPLQKEIKQEIYARCFISKVGSDFIFKRIRKELEKLTGTAYAYEPNKRGTINYKDEQSVPGCPIISRFVQLFGDEWEKVVIEGTKERNSQSKTAPKRHVVTYTAEDIWHVCFTADEKEDVEHFGKNSLQWDDDKVSQLVRLWGCIKQGYGMLSLKAIRNINRMLGYGLDLSDAIFLAKIPELVGIEKWENNDGGVKGIIDKYLSEIKGGLYHSRTICKIVNTLISNYKNLPEQYSFAYKDTSYVLQDSDLQDIDSVIVDVIGGKTWGEMSYDEQAPIISEVRTKYQEFFASNSRDYCKAKRLADYLAQFLTSKIEGFDSNKLSKLYHPSMTEFPTINHGNVDRSEWKLGSPKLGGIRNPVALRTLHVLRRKVNALLEAQKIDPETTRVVIETTREINDANMRWAIAQYQKKREEENKVIGELLKEFFPDSDITERELDKANCFMMQKKGKDAIEIDDDYAYGDNVLFPFTGKKEKVEKDRKTLVQKYTLWKEQGGVCLYTGTVISFGALFNGEQYDIEHTLPRSKSFDDSQANLTICEQHYNRAIKSNTLPVDLPNYKEDATIDGITYTAILPRLKAWEKRVEKLQDNVNYWKAQSRKAQDKSRKDDCIRQRHLWQMELDYWRDKLSRFKMKEIPQGFRHRQLADTGIISRYAVLYLKTVFQNVEVQKGEVTAMFRKILGVQSIEDKKDRSLHTHHAIDATILTLIPFASKREKMLQLFYEREESVKDSMEYQRLSRELQNELQSCAIGNNPENITDLLNNELLVNILSKDKVLVPSCKNWRSHGKIVKYKDVEGNEVKKKRKGASIRGSLHKDTIYGTIVYPKTEEGKPLTENGVFVYDDYTPRMVARVAIADFSGIEDFDNIVDYTLRTKLKKIVETRIKEGKSFSASLAEGLWQVDKRGHEVRNGKRPIRHVRCFVKSGRGFLTYDKSLQIKDQNHLSEKSLVHLPNRNHKSRVSVQNEDNLLLFLYACNAKGKIKRTARIVNVFEVAKLKCHLPELSCLSDISRESYYATLQKKKDCYDLYAILKRGTRVLKWEKSYEELYDMTKPELSKRLFYVKNFNNTGTIEQPRYRIYVQSHLEALENTLSYSPRDFNFLIEGVDFTINVLGEIEFEK